MKAGERENVISHEYTQDDKLMHNGRVTKEEGNLTIFKRYAVGGVGVAEHREETFAFLSQFPAVLGLPLSRKKGQEDEIRK